MPTPVPSATATPEPTATPNATPTPAGPLIILGREDVAPLDPFGSSGPIARAVAGTLADTLLHVDPADGSLIPGLATGWQVSDDVQTITFSLPADRRWSDGRPLTADDVAYSIRQALDADQGKGIGPYIHLVSAITAVDPQHVRVRLAAGLCAALYDLAAIPIVPQHVWAGRADPSRQMITGGAYAVRVPGQAQFIRNPNYAPTPATFSEWAYRQATDASKMTEALASGTAHAALLPADNADPSADDVRLLAAPSRRLTSLAYRPDHEILQDPRVRQALAHAVDRKALVQTLFGHAGLLPRTHLPPHHWAAEQAPDPPAYDPAEAARLLDRAGWTDSDSDGIRDRDGQPLRLDLLAPLGSQQAEDIPVVLRHQLRPLGIDLRPQFAEPLIFQDNLYDNQFEIALVTWDTGLDPDQLDLWHSPGSDDAPAYNFTRYTNLDVDRWLDEARALPTCDPERRAALYGQVWQALQRDQPYTVLFAWPQTLLVRQGLTGPRLSPFVNPLWNLAQWRWGPASP